MSRCIQLVSRGSPARSSRGFTLLELLLTVTILLLLVTALVVNLSPMRRGAALDEGVSRLESLIRFSRAEAANRGRTVRLEFQSATTNSAAEPSLDNVRLSWEPDPVGAPGAFQQLPRALWDFDLDDTIDIVAVRPVPGQQSAADAVTASPAAPPRAKDSTAPKTKEDSTALNPPAVISFYPDGSSDSAEVIVNSKDDDDPREFSIRLMGTTGWIYHQSVTNEVPAAESDLSRDQIAEDPF